LRTLLSPILFALAAAPAIAQVPCSTTNYGTNLGLTDETMSTAQSLGFSFTYNGTPYTDIQVCDNGYITLGVSGGQPDWDPLATTLVTDVFPRICPLWVDLEPGASGGGDVYFRAVPASGGTPAYAVITWKDVLDYGGTTPHTFQLFLVANGQVRCSYNGNLAAIPASNPWLVGASPGNNAALNPVDFGTLPIATAGNATLHEEGVGALDLAGRTLDWLPDGTGGYTIANGQQCATASAYGSGCGGSYMSVYEHFTTTPSIDLSNTAFSLVFTGTTYVVVPGTAAFVAPSATATNLNLDDDDETTVSLSTALAYPGGTTTSLNICSNGHISTATNAAQFDYSPTPREFLDWPNATWAVWRDMIPTTTGPDNVWFEEVGGVAYVTWLNVVGYVGAVPGTTPTTFQLQFHLATGNVEFVFQSLDSVSVSTWSGGEGWVVGFSPGGVSVDPGSTDLTTGLPVQLGTSDVAALHFAASAMPVVGTAITLDTTNIPAGSPFGAIVFGFQTYNPGLSLANIGMPGCFQYTDSMVTLLYFPFGSSSVATPFNTPNMAGLTFGTQALVYAAGTTPLGVIASNGLVLTVGY
jgi:hypothetical protein